VKIVLRKWGGFTGKAGAEIHEVDLATLSAEEAARLRKLVEDARLPSLPPKLAKSAPQPWDFRHSLTVEDGGSSRTIEFHEDAATPELKRLAQEIAQAGRPP
jgi:hypothetical protein